MTACFTLLFSDSADEDEEAEIDEDVSLIDLCTVQNLIFNAFTLEPLGHTFLQNLRKATHY